MIPRTRQACSKANPSIFIYIGPNYIIISLIYSNWFEFPLENIRI